MLNGCVKLRIWVMEKEVNAIELCVFMLCTFIHDRNIEVHGCFEVGVVLWTMNIVNSGFGSHKYVCGLSVHGLRSLVKI